MNIKQAWQHQACLIFLNTISHPLTIIIDRFDNEKIPCLYIPNNK
jgi:hypothetical protein